MKQYELWWAELPSPIDTRPVLLLSRDGAYAYLDRIIVVEVTSRAYGIPQELAIGRREGLARASVARFDILRSIPKRLLTERIGRLAPARHGEAKAAMGYTLGWSELFPR